MNGLSSHLAVVGVDWTGGGVVRVEPPAEVNVRSFSVPAASSVSAIASAAQAAAIFAAWGR